MKTGHVVLALGLVLGASAIVMAARSGRRMGVVVPVSLLVLSSVCIWIAARSAAFDTDTDEKFSEPVESCIVSTINWFGAAVFDGAADGIYADAEPETRALIDLADEHFPLADEPAPETGRYPDAVIESYYAARARLLMWGCVAAYGSDKDKILRVQEGLCASDFAFDWECS
jgi:hypothetical protein